MKMPPKKNQKSKFKYQNHIPKIKSFGF